MILHAAFWRVVSAVKTILVFVCVVIGGVFLFVGGVVLLILGSPATSWKDV